MKFAVRPYRALKLGLERLGSAVLQPTEQVDRQALIVTMLAMALGLLVFICVPADPARLGRFAPEHVTMFTMVDSTPLRIAFLVFFGTLIAGAVTLRLTNGAAHGSLEMTSRHQRLAGLLVILIAGLNIMALGDYGIPRSTRGLVVSAIVGLMPAGAVAAVVWFHSRWHRIMPVIVALIVLFALLPAATGLMHRVSLPFMPWVDLHMAALFSGGELLTQGYRLFIDVPIGYGTLTPLVLAVLAKAGLTIDLLWLLHVTELFQALTLGLFMLALWQRTQGCPAAGRSATLLLMVMVIAPFLSTGSYAVLFANQSGFRFVMVPLAVLALVGLQRLPLALSSALGGVLTVLALLHNLETGIAILAGLGLAWLVQARKGGKRAAALGATAAFLAATMVAGVGILLHWAVMGAWPNADLAEATNLFRQFGAGFGGLQPKLRVVALVVFGHAGYLVVRALSAVLGRQTDRVDVVSTGIAGILIAWAPYYMNRPHDWNLWSYLALYTLLVAPALAARKHRAGIMALTAMLVLVPIPLATARDDVRNLMTASDMLVEEGCGDGLSLPPEACAEHRARAAELVRLAASGDVVWMTGYPLLTLRLARLRPLVAPLDLFGAALTEADLEAVATRVAAVHPIALLLDRVESSLVGGAIPAPVAALHARIAARAGYAPCLIISVTQWNIWLPSGMCEEHSPTILTLRARLARR